MGRDMESPCDRPRRATTAAAGHQLVEWTQRRSSLSKVRVVRRSRPRRTPRDPKVPMDPQGPWGI